MKISEIGEDPFIQRIKEKMDSNLPEGIVGIEDDCAVVPFDGQPNNKVLLLSTDSLVEGCHFLRDIISPEDLGYKAVMVNVSDIAAMGGKSLYILMSIALPNNVEDTWLNGYLKGVSDACSEVGIFLIGGDTTASKDGIFINFTIVGEVEKSHVKYRKNAKNGDLICITAGLGDSLAGFHSLMEGSVNRLTQKHCRPKAHFNEGLWLGKQEFVHAMMDLSDGLYLDLARMMLASGVGAEINLDKIPLSKDFTQFAKKHNWNEAEQAVVSGEEYCLLLTIDPIKYEELNEAFTRKFSYPLSVIGRVVGDKGVTYLGNGQSIEIKSKPYFHFNEK